MYTFIGPISSSMMAPGLPEIAVKYELRDQTVIALTLCIFLLALAIGPLIFGPLSEIYGRTWVLHIANIAFCGFNVGCGFTDSVGGLIGLRFLAGFAGSAPVGIGGGTISDLWDEKSRAGAMAVYAMGPLLGGVIGPIAGGYITQGVGVKWTFVVVSGASAIAAVIGVIFLSETYAPVIRMRIAKREGKMEQFVKAYPEFSIDKEDKLRLFWVNISRPVVLLFGNFVCFLLSTYMAFMYGIFYLMFTTFGSFFGETYGFKAGSTGLTYLGLGIGFFSAAIFGAKTAAAIYAHLSKKNGGVGKPEYRIPALLVGSFFVPIGLFWYGWSADAKTHWILPIIGSGIFGFGMMTTFLPIQLYLVDTFRFAASATAAASLFRSLFGFAFPLWGDKLFEALGLGGGNSLLAGLAIVLGIPFPVWLFYYGERWRARNRQDL
ncbi:MFS general substrate transporter [Atractiella rhizophila]|nr:MFS general substrate transporter [Atractiella rhizophila]